MQVTNTNSQLKLTNATLVEYYKYETFKSVSWNIDTKGYYVSINFIANDKNNSLRLYLVDVDNQGSWTNTAAGAAQAVNDIAFMGRNCFFYCCYYTNRKVSNSNKIYRGPH